MLKNNFTLYAIPGWGFSSEILSCIKNNDLNVIKLDYFELSNTALEAIAKKFSKIIPNNSLLLGWSFGGLIAIKLAFLYPHKIKKLILISSQPKFLSEISWQGINQYSAYYFRKKFNNNTLDQITKFIRLVSYPIRYYNNKNFLINYFLYDNIENLSALLDIFFNSDLREDYQNLSSEVLHIISEKDAVIKQDKEQLKKLNPDINIVSLVYAGHAGFLNYPLVYKKIIKEFLMQ